MENSRKFLSGDELKKKLAHLPEYEPPVEPSGRRSRPAPSPYIEAAAVLAYYDPEKINPVGAPSAYSSETNKELIAALVGCSRLVADTRQATPQVIEKGDTRAHVIDYAVRFILEDDVRRETLTTLAQNGRLALAIQANTPDAGEPLQEMLTAALQGKMSALTNLNLEQLNSLLQVSAWVEGVSGLSFIPPRMDIQKSIAALEMLMPLKQLTGTYESGEFVSFFRGRKEELSTLRSYVGVAPPQGIKEAVGRAFTAITSVIFTSTQKPLLIFGIGGVGKSTLLAQFLLEHWEAYQSDRFPFVYLDFDRPQLSALEPVTLLIEGARQLSIQYQDNPQLFAGFKDFYEKWQRVYGTLTDSGGSSGPGSSFVKLNSENVSVSKMSSRLSIQNEFLQLIRQLGANTSRPFVMVLDTFEEVQYKGTSYVQEVYSFMTQLQQQYPSLRTVIAGRAPVASLDLYPLELKNLDREAAIAFLGRMGVKNETEAKQIVAQVGGNPLTLKLAAGLYADQGLTTLKDVNVNESGNIFYKRRLPERQIQGMLYQRILDHIHKPQVKQLAYPGMVLRRITPEIILQVLAGPCDLKITSSEQAQKLFDDLREEVSLVIPSEPGVLRHRPDVRKAMLQLLKESDKKDTVAAIHRLAVNYYSTKEATADRAEEFYHRLSLDESPRDLQPRWIPGMQNYLFTNLDELPPRAQAFIFSMAGQESSDLSIWESADVEDYNRHLGKQAANFLNAGYAERALDVLKDIQPGKGTEVLSIIKARAQNQLKQYPEALETANQALGSYYADELPLEVSGELRRLAYSISQTIGIEPSNTPPMPPSSSPPPPYQADDSEMSTFAL